MRLRMFSTFAFIFLLAFLSWFPCGQARRYIASSSTCESGVMSIEQFQWHPVSVPSPGFVYYTLKATVSDAESAKRLSKGDLQMVIELLSPEHGIVPMPCSEGFGSCCKPVRDYAPYFGRMLAEGQTTILINDKEVCLFDAATMGSLYASGKYRITAKFLDYQTHKTLSCYQFEIEVEHGSYTCSCGDKDKDKEKTESVK